MLKSSTCLCGIALVAAAANASAQSSQHLFSHGERSPNTAIFQSFLHNHGFHSGPSTPHGAKSDERPDDGISASSAPEPETLMLIATGLTGVAGLATLRRKRKAKSE